MRPQARRCLSPCPPVLCTTHGSPRRFRMCQGFGNSVSSTLPMTHTREAGVCALRWASPAQCGPKPATVRHAEPGECHRNTHPPAPRGASLSKVLDTLQPIKDFHTLDRLRCTTAFPFPVYASMRNRLSGPAVSLKLFVLPHASPPKSLPLCRTLPVLLTGYDTPAVLPLLLPMGGTPTGCRSA